MDQSFAKSMCDFSFGMLFMAQLVCAAAMYYKGQRNDLQKMMFRFMVYLVLISVVDFFFFYTSGKPLPTLSAPETDFLEMTVVPCALFILIRLTTPRQKMSRLIAINALAYFMAFVLYIITDNTVVYQATLLLTIIYSLGILIYGYYAVERFNRQMEADFSDEELSLYWLKYIVCLYAGMLSLWVAATLYSSEVMATFYNLVMIVLLGLFCYFVYRQEDMLKALDNLDREEKKRDYTRAYEFEGRFRKVFEEEKIYLNPKLNIVELSMAVGTNRTYISNYINQQLHTTFYAYVNKWRVKRAKNLLSSTSLPLEDVAAQSGFNSLSSFHRYFTKSMGMTPQAFRKKTLPA